MLNGDCIRALGNNKVVVSDGECYRLDDVEYAGGTVVPLKTG
jgi:hypothetical protein